MKLSKDWLLHPFRRIAGFEALWLGLGLMLLSGFIAWPAHTHFDGAVDIHIGDRAAPLWIHLAEPFLAWGCTLIVFLLVSRLGAGSRFRAIDLAGTLALSRAPLLLVSPIGFFLAGPADPLHPGPAVLLTIIPLLVASIWSVVLMYQAFKISVNPKQQRSALLFVLAIILAEAASKSLFFLIYRHFIL